MRKPKLTYKDARHIHRFWTVHSSVHRKRDCRICKKLDYAFTVTGQMEVPLQVTVDE